MEYSAHHIRPNYWVDGYLASEDDDLFDDPCSLIFEELLNYVGADRAGSDDGEFRVSRHEVISICCV